MATCYGSPLGTKTESETLWKPGENVPGREKLKDRDRVCRAESRSSWSRWEEEEGRPEVKGTGPGEAVCSPLALTLSEVEPGEVT